MAWKIEIGSPGAMVDRTDQVRLKDPVGIQLTYNERGTAQFTTLPTYRPNLRDEVKIYAQDGTTVIFGGIVYQRQTTSVGQLTFTQCDCADWSVYGDWVYADLTYAADTTLQVVLQDLVAMMAGYGVSLDASDYSGVTLVAFAWSNKRITDALRELSDQTGYIWRFSVDKVLTLTVPGAVAADFDLSDATPHCRTVEWRDESTNYASKVRVICGPNGTATVLQTWTANGTDDHWVTDFPSAGIAPTYCTIDGVQRALGAFSGVAENCYLSMTANPAAGPPYDVAYNFANGETIVLGGVTYTWRTTLTPAAGEVLIGASTLESFNHLIAAIMGQAGAGTTYVATAAPNAPPRDFRCEYFGGEYAPNMLQCKAYAPGDVNRSCTTTAAHLKIYGEGNVNITQFQLGEDPAGAPYTFDLATHTLTVGTDPIPANGVIITLAYVASFPFTVTAGSDAPPVVEYVTTAPDIMTLAAGQQLADALLARMSGSQKTIEFTTLEEGLEPGQALSIILSDRGLNVAAAFIQTIEIALLSDLIWEYRVTAIEGSEYLGSYLEYFRKLLGGAGTAVISSSGGDVTIAGVPSPRYLGGSRFHAVQVPA